MFEIKCCDFGMVGKGVKVEFCFELENIYEEDIYIVFVCMSCCCVIVEVIDLILEIWEKGVIVVCLNMDVFFG